MSLKFKQYLKLFKNQLNINLTPGGIFNFTSFGKEPIDLARYDNERWEDRPNDNVAKFRIDQTPYIIFDTDDDICSLVEKEYPTLAKTFYTTTTKPYKRHYYVLPPEGITTKPLFRLVKPSGLDYDILSNGTLFELHGVKDSSNPNYTIQNKPVQHLSQHEWAKLKSLLDTKPESKSVKNAYYYNTTMAELIRKYLSQGKLSRAEMNRLIKLCTPSEYTENVKSKKLEWPPLNHDNFNKIAYIVFNNGAIDTETEGLPFLEKLLTDVYNVDLSSKETQKHLYNSILVTLPRHPNFTKQENTEELDLAEHAALIKVKEDQGTIKFLNNKSWEYAVINLNTLDIVQLSPDSLFITEGAMKKLLKVNNKDWPDYHNTMPTVKLVNNPYKPKFFYDIENDIMCYNLSKQTVYQKNALEQDKLSEDNVVYRLIQSYYGPYTELYLHWLAHTMFGNRSPHTVLLAVSPPEAPAGTGKTLTTSSIPQRLIYAAQTVSEDVISSGWGQVFLGKRLLTLNDLRSKDIWSKMIYSEIRNKTTGGQRRYEQLKYGGFIEHTESVSFSVSANFLPPLDPHDRRAFVVLPQQIYGETSFLDDDDAMKINQMFEGTSLETYIPELQELANYLLYLYNNEREKFKQELYIRAPETKGRELCISESKGTARSLLTILSKYPEDLSMEIRHDNDVLIAQNCLRNERDVVAFILMQYNKETDAAYLPWMFFSELLALTQNERAGRKSSPAAVAASLGITKTQFKHTVSKKYLKYKDKKELAKYGLCDQISKWSVTNIIAVSYTHLTLPTKA